ncbi:uncharacterized protein LOC111035945 isoform X1 [Myzus persicae]|uniref:uncharacterized protein LOC111035945 isoform X1 n=1 Tax=Myzus persicae TaxID=13164 RepID=UPI000B936DD7|nr:uncharacterized protein LOC111035945 isoform X1 [Myzus persicae]
MNTLDVISSSCDLFRRGRFTDCCDLIQLHVDNCHLQKITIHDEVEFIILRNNLLVCNSLRILPEISTEYVGKMTEFMNISQLFLYEKHIPLELRINFVYNTLHWYWLKPIDIPDYCYNKIMTLVNESLHEVLHENGKSIVNLGSHIGNEQDILNSLECLSNGFLGLEPILVVQCLEISQILLLIFLSQRSFTSLLVNFTMELINQVKTITCAFKVKKPNHVANCFKLGLSKINVFLDTEHMRTIITSGHVALCIRHILENQHQQALSTLNTIEQYVNQNDEFFCLLCYLKALANFNLEQFEITLCYLSQMVKCLMEPFIKSRCYLLLGRTHLKMGNSDLAIQSLEELKESEFNNIMAYYVSQHYGMNNMQFMQMVVLEQAIKGDFDGHKGYEELSNSYTTKVLIILHPQPDLTKKQLLYLAAKKKYEHTSYNLAASTYLSILNLDEVDQYVSDLVTIPPMFMLKHEAAVALLKARKPEEAFKLCQSLIEEYEPGYGMWKSGSFWADELNGYNFNVVGTMLLAETGFNKNTDMVLEALNKSFNCLYAKISFDCLTEPNDHEEESTTLRRILIGKILLLKATILSKLNKEEDCEAAFKKALTYNTGDEDIVYLYSKWLEHKGKLLESMKVRDQFDRNKINTITCDNIVMTFVLENKHGLEDTIIGENVMDDLFASPDDKSMDLDNEMDPADDDIFNNLFLD